jgi:molecular chaperone DnaK (HSP70)
MGRRKGDGNRSLPKNNLIQYSEGNEENGGHVPDTNKTKINDTNDPNGVHKNILKEEMLQIITENFMEMLLDIVNQNVQEALKKFQDTKNEEYEKTQKQINELISALNKHQCETENTINIEINELKRKTENIKKEVTMIWKTSEKRVKQKHKTQWEATPAD